MDIKKLDEFELEIINWASSMFLKIVIKIFVKYVIIPLAFSVHL